MEFTQRPQWLDDDFLKTCVRNSKRISDNTEITLSGVKVNYAVPRGENYLSVIYRVSVDFHIENDVRDENESFIVKSILNQEHTLADLIYTKEVDMYTNVLPTVKSKLEGGGLATELSCRLLHHTDGENLTVVLEDLKCQGYAVPERFSGLDEEHCKLALLKLARFHAASMAHLYNKEHAVDESYRKNAFESPENEAVVSAMEAMGRQNASLITDSLPRNARYKKAIEFLDTYAQVMHRVRETGVLSFKSGNKFNSINHGDCWINNIMFKYNSDGKPEDCLYIDLQECNYSSVANDFNTFFFTSASQQVRRDRFRVLQRFYFENLLSTLRQLEYGGELPTLEEFRRETRTHGLVVAYAMVTFFPLIFMRFDEKTQARDASEMFSLSEVQQLVNEKISSSLFLDVCRNCVEVLIEEEYFENTPLPDPGDDRTSPS